MTVFFVGSGPGDPELLTIKAHALIRKARCCVYAGSLVGDEILHLIPKQARRYDSAQMDLDEIIQIISDADREGIDVVRLHSGDPSIYGAIGEQMTRLRRLGIDYQVIPGISSFQAAAAALKLELTAPEVAQTIVLTRISGRTPVPEEQALSQLAKTRATLCLFLSVHKIEGVVRTLIPTYGQTCPAAVVYRVSREDQTIIRGTLADIAIKTRQEKINKTALILVGPALGAETVNSKLYDKVFSHGYRKAKTP